MKKKANKEKPTPFKWSVTPHGVVEHYDFQYWKKSDPPPIGEEAVILPFYCGYLKGNVWISR